MLEKDIYIAGELIKRGEPVYIEGNTVYVQRVIDSAVDCDHYDDEYDHYDDDRIDCAWMEISCPLELVNRKYCREYEAKK